MASSGGGKIRNKRPRGTKTPYQRPKSILSQVRETVTGLVVPTWLRSIWSNGGETEDESEGTVLSEPASPDFDPDIPSTSYGTGLPPSRRGLHHQEEDDDDDDPVAHRLEDEATETGNSSRRNTPLHFISYDQPIETSTPVDNEFVPPPRELPDEAQDNDTDSSVSTSGCSSLVPHVDRVDHKEKLAKSNLDQLSEWGQSSNSTPSRMSLWSETNTSGSSQARRGMRPAVSKPQPAAKRPRFNVSYFGTPRPANTSLTEGERHQSSFYAGKTTFGGSSCYRSPAAKRRHNPSPYQVHLSVKRHIRPKPAARSTADPDFGVTSNTAMKILNTLDRMSTPLSDAKRIPLTPVPSPFAFKPRRVAMSERKKRPSAGPPVSGLQVGETATIIPNTQPPLPKPAVTRPPRVSQEENFDRNCDGCGEGGIFGLHFRCRTCPKYRLCECCKDRGTHSQHQFEESSRSEKWVPSSMQLSSTRPIVSNQHSLSTPPIIPAARVNKNTAQQRTVVPPASPPKSGGKMKTKSRNPLHYSASKDDDENDVMEVPDLPKVPLPISSKAMPTFNFGNVQSKPPGGTAPASPFARTVNGGGGRSPAPPFASPELVLPGEEPSLVKSIASRGKCVSPLKTSTPFPGASAAAQFKFTMPAEVAGPGAAGFKFSAPAVKGSAVSPVVSATTAAVDQEFTFRIPNLKDSGAEKGNLGFSFVKPLENEVHGEGETSSQGGGGLKIATSLKSGSCLQALGLGSSKPAASTTSDAPKAAAGENTSLFEKFRPAPGSWECGNCLVRNGAGSLKCAVCDFAKPGAKGPSRHSPSPSGSSLADKFRPPPGSWECPRCLIRNKAEDSNCVACQTTRASQAGGRETNTIPLGEQFKPPKGSWDCDTCLVQNRAAADTCVACAAKRPGARQPAKAPPPEGGAMSLTEMFRPPAGSWECRTCMIQNQGTDSKCAACQSLKPGASQTDGSRTQSPGFSIPGSGFNSTTPLPPAFGSKRVGGGETAAADGPPPAKPSLPDPFKPAGESWECATCMVHNRAPVSRCAACEAPRPGTEPTLKTPPASSFKFGSSTGPSESATQPSGGFRIGGTTSSGSSALTGGFHMNSGATFEGAVNPSAGGFKLPAGGIKFVTTKNNDNVGSSLSAASSDTVSSSAGFSLGSVQDKGPSAGVSLQPSKNLDRGSKVAGNLAPLSSGFKFGESVDDGRTTNRTTFSFGASSTTGEVDKPPSAGVASLIGQGPIANKARTIGGTSAVPGQSNVIIQFGSKPSEPSQSNQKTTPNVNPFQGGLTSTDSKPDFMFGAAASDSRPSASVSKQAGSSSFLVTTTALPGTNSNAFQFGSTDKATPQGPAGQLEKRKGPEPSSTSSLSSAGPPTKAGLTGSTGGLLQPIPTLGASKTPPTGGPPQTANATPFKLGAKPQLDTLAAPDKSPFTFGAKSQAPASNASGFQFGTVSSSSGRNSQRPSDRKQISFGSTTTTLSTAASFTASNSFPGFDSAGTGTTAPAVPSFGGTSGVFGAPSGQQNSIPVSGQQNSFGMAANSGPSFGSGTSSPAFGSSTVPAFGTSSQPNANNAGFQVNAAKAPSFQFGQNNNSNLSAGSFPFGAGAQPAPSTAGFGFNFNASQPPSFNFSASSAGGQPSFQFNAAPTTTEANPFNASAPPPSGRKIKKAVRRTRKT